MTKPCIFCGEECIYDEDDEGCAGVIIGKRVICGGCLEQLKEALEEGWNSRPQRP